MARKARTYHAEYVRRGGSPSIMASRNARARRQGWQSYTQARTWTVVHELPLGPKRGWSDAQRRTIAELAEECCEGQGHARRPASLFCESCNLTINPPGIDGVFAHSDRSSTWQQRLVAHVEELRREKALLARAARATRSRARGRRGPS